MPILKSCFIIVVSYFLAVAFASSIWRMTFPFFAKVGARKA